MEVNPTTAAIDALDRVIAECRDLLATARLRSKHYFLDQAVLRYMWGAIANAELALLAAKEGHPSGTAALKRYLHETNLDLAYMLSDKDPDLCVAKSVLADFQDWKKVADLHGDVAAQFPDVPLSLPKEWAHALEQSMAETVARLDSWNKGLQGPLPSGS